MYTNSDKPLILASTSPRRIEMLRSLGIDFEQKEPNCDEAVLPNEAPEQLVKRLAYAKAHSLSENFKDRFIIGADTVVFLNDKILGKPKDKKEAREMLGAIQGRTHVVWGGFAVLSGEKKISEVHVTQSEVRLRKLSLSQIDSYIETKEPMDKAGAYAIQGIGASLVEEVHGSYSNVVGLDLSKLILILLSVGAIQ